MTDNIEPICGVCGKLLTTKDNEFDCYSCKELLEGIKTDKCEGCGNIFSYHAYIDKLVLEGFFDGNKNRRKKIKIWQSHCPRCRKAHEVFSGGKLAHWIGYGLEHGTTIELIQLALEAGQTTKDDLKHKRIPEELFS